MQTPYGLIKIVFAAKLESIFAIMAAWWIGKALNESYPRDFSWNIVTFGFAFIVIIRSFYTIIVQFLKLQNSKKSSNQPSKQGSISGIDLE